MTRIRHPERSEGSRRSGEILRCAQNDTRGLTLPEMMIVVAILGVIVSMGPTLLKQLSQYYLLGNARIQLQRDGRTALALMTKDIKGAVSQSISIDRLNSTEPFYSRITLTRKYDGQQIVYYKDQSNLKMQIGSGGQTRILTDSLSNLSFLLTESDNIAYVTVGLDLQKSPYQGNTVNLNLGIQNVRVMD